MGITKRESVCLLPIPVHWLSIFISLRFAKHRPLKCREEGGGTRVCARILGRRELGREPTSFEVEDLIARKRPQIITEQDAMAAYDCRDDVRWHSTFQVPTSIL